MPEKNIIIQANSNFHHAEGQNLFEKDDAKYMEYRRKWNEWPAQFHVGDFPLFIDVEVTSVCNMKCPFCATTFRKDEIKQGFISYNHVQKIINEGAENSLYGVKFNIRGEPLLHKEIDKMVGYAKKKGLIDVYFNTNAMRLTDEMARRLIDAGLDRLSISFEGISKEMYDKYRVGGDYAKVLKNIENIQNLKAKLNVNYPKIRIQTVLLDDVAPIFDEYKRFWSQIADEVAYLDYKEMKDKKKGVEYPWACPQIWQRMSIWWDGTILPCNHDDDALLQLGNIENITIKDAWHSEQSQNLRTHHQNGVANKVNACDGCYLRDSEIAKLMEQNKS